MQNSTTESLTEDKKKVKVNPVNTVINAIAGLVSAAGTTAGTLLLPESLSTLINTSIPNLFDFEKPDEDTAQMIQQGLLIGAAVVSVLPTAFMLVQQKNSFDKADIKLAEKKAQHNHPPLKTAKTIQALGGGGIKGFGQSGALAALVFFIPKFELPAWAEIATIVLSGAAMWHAQYRNYMSTSTSGETSPERNLKVSIAAFANTTLTVNSAEPLLKILKIPSPYTLIPTLVFGCVLVGENSRNYKIMCKKGEELASQGHSVGWTLKLGAVNRGLGTIGSADKFIKGIGDLAGVSGIGKDALNCVSFLFSVAGGVLAYIAQEQMFIYGANRGGGEAGYETLAYDPEAETELFELDSSRRSRRGSNSTSFLDSEHPESGSPEDNGDTDNSSTPFYQHLPKNLSVNVESIDYRSMSVSVSVSKPPEPPEEPPTTKCCNIF
jgi:hypothetical protein